MWPSGPARSPGWWSSMMIYKGGDTPCEDLERSYRPLPETVLSLTGGGGEHYRLRAPWEHGQKRRRHASVPGSTSGAMAATSSRPRVVHTSGKRYVWEVLHEPGRHAPGAHACLAARAVSGHQAQKERISAGEPILDGQRNDTLFRLGCSFRARGCTEAGHSGGAPGDECDAVSATADRGGSGEDCGQLCDV